MAGERARAATIGTMLVAISSLASCLGEIDYAGKLCGPESACPSGWFCNSGVCSRAAPASSSTPACTPGFEAADFHAAWQTTSSVRWEWTPRGTAETFGRYELHLDPNRKQLEAHRPSVVLDSQTNAELGYLDLPTTGSGKFPVNASVAHGLGPPGTAWFGRLVVFDRVGCAFESPIVPAQLRGTPSFGAVLFADALRPGGFLTPTGASGQNLGRFAFQPNCDGNPCLEFVADAAGGENLLLHTNVAASELATMSQGRFDQAFVELRIWLDSEDAYWTGFWLVADGRKFSYEPYGPVRTTKPALQSSYRVVQIPLRDLDGGGETKMTLGDLAAGISQFRFYTQFAAGSRVWIDDVALRW